MNKFFKSKMIKSMLPYFILAVGVIIMHQIVSQIITADSFVVEIFSRFWHTIAPFLTGAMIAYILNLPCSGIQKLLGRVKNKFVQRKSRALSVLILVLIIIAIFALTLNWVIPAVIESAVMFGDEFETYMATVAVWIDNFNAIELPEFLDDILHIDEATIIAMAQDFMADFDGGGFTAGLIAGLGGAASAVFHMFITIVSSIYILIEKDRLKAFVCRFLAAVTETGTYNTILKYSCKLNNNFRQYIYTQTLDGLILGTIMIAVLFFGFRSPYALILGLILGILNYIPYFGSIVGTAIAVLVIAITQGLTIALIATVVLFAIQQLDGNVIQPRLMGETFALSPLLIIISVTIGNVYGGILGMLIAIPIVAILKDLLDTYILYREEKKLIPPDPAKEHYYDREFHG